MEVIKEFEKSFIKRNIKYRLRFKMTTDKKSINITAKVISLEVMSNGSR